MSSNHGWDVMQEAVPTNISTSQQLIESIHGELGRLLKLAQDYSSSFFGRGMVSWEAFQQDVVAAGQMTNLAFGLQAETNLKMYYDLEQNIDEQTSNTQDTHGGTDLHATAGINVRG